MTLSPGIGVLIYDTLKYKCQGSAFGAALDWIKPDREQRADRQVAGASFRGSLLYQRGVLYHQNRCH